MEFYFSDLNIKSDKDILLFETSFSGFIDIDINVIGNEKIEIISKEESYEKLSEQSEISKLDKLLIIHDVINIIKESPSYLDFTLDPSNIYLDATKNVKILDRFISKEDKDYLLEVKALSVSLINNTSYEVELNSSFNNIKFHFNLEEITDLEEFDLKILECYENLKKNEMNNKMLVNKKNYKRLKNTSMVRNIIIIALLIFLLFFYFYFYKFQDARANAYAYYLTNDYSNVIAELNDYGDSNRLTTDDRVMLTLSIINNQALTDSQIQTLSADVTNQSVEEIFLYWNSIASNNYEDAIKYAQILESADLEIFACWQYLDYLEVANIDSDEKVELINQYTQQADALIEQRDKDLESAFAEEEEEENSSIEEQLNVTDE